MVFFWTSHAVFHPAAVSAASVWRRIVSELAVNLVLTSLWREKQIFSTGDQPSLLLCSIFTVCLAVTAATEAPPSPHPSYLFSSSGELLRHRTVGSDLHLFPLCLCLCVRLVVQWQTPHLPSLTAPPAGIGGDVKAATARFPGQEGEFPDSAADEMPQIDGRHLVE